LQMEKLQFEKIAIMVDIINTLRSLNINKKIDRIVGLLNSL